MLKIEYLYYLIQISSCKSLHIAAEKLFVTQPTLSAAIKKLEQELNTKLLRRTYQGVALTEEGEYVVAQAKIALQYLCNIENHFRKDCSVPNNLPLQEITLYLTPEISNKHAPHILEALYKDNKNILITVREDDNDNIYTKLKNDNKTLGIVYCVENTKFDDCLVSSVISKSRAYLMLRKDTALVPPFVDEISLKEVANIPLIIPQASDEFHDSLLSLVSMYGTPKIFFRSPNFYITDRMVQDDTAATFYFSVGNTDLDPHYRIVPIKKTPRYILALLHHRDFDSDHILYLQDVMQKVFINTTQLSKSTIL